jgi:putative selenium metabolism hydrolase
MGWSIVLGRCIEMRPETRIDDASLLEFARQLVRTPSISGSEERAVRLVAQQMALLGFDDVEVDSVGNCVGIVGGGGPTLLIDGHIDSVPVQSPERWTVDPLGADVIDGRLYGLGICDQKASIAAACFGVAAASEAIRALGGTVVVVASVNEEDVEGAALRSVVERFQPQYAVTSEPSDTRLCIGQRGRAKVSATVVGRSCHAGHVRQGINAAEGLAAVIAEVRTLEHPHHARLGGRDITCIDIASRPYPSVSTVPGWAVARFDARFLPGETVTSLLETIRAAAGRAWATWHERPQLELDVANAAFKTWTGLTFSVPEFKPAWWTAESSPIVVQAARAMSSQGLDPTPTHYSFCTNGSYLAGEAAIPTIGFGVGEEHLAHQADEYVTLESLRKGARGFAALAMQFAAGDRL